MWASTHSTINDKKKKKKKMYTARCNEEEEKTKMRVYNINVLQNIYTEHNIFELIECVRFVSSSSSSEFVGGMAVAAETKCLLSVPAARWFIIEKARNTVEKHTNRARWMAILW